MKNIIKYLVVISYLGTVTNFIPLSVVMLFFIPLSVFSIFFNGDKRFRKIEVYICLLFIYVIASTLFYAPDSFLDYDFYRKDGNFIISYLVLLFYIFLPFSLSINVDKLIPQTLFIFA
ncbi:O-antigen ligase domain-containing protein, partial [Klebsiella pneumoniae]